MRVWKEDRVEQKVEKTQVVAMFHNLRTGEALEVA